MAIFSGPKLKFEDLTMDNAFLTCYIGLAKYGWRFQEAQKWLDREIMNKMEPVMPRRTGNLIARTRQVNETFVGSGMIKTYGTSYGKKLYSGINPRTGVPYHWTNPLTQPYWGQWVMQQYRPDLQKGVKDIILKGRK